MAFRLRARIRRAHRAYSEATARRLRRHGVGGRQGLCLLRVARRVEALAAGVAQEGGRGRIALRSSPRRSRARSPGFAMTTCRSRARAWRRRGAFPPRPMSGRAGAARRRSSPRCAPRAWPTSRGCTPGRRSCRCTASAVERVVREMLGAAANDPGARDWALRHVLAGPRNGPYFVGVREGGPAKLVEVVRSAEANGNALAASRAQGGRGARPRLHSLAQQPGRRRRRDALRRGAAADEGHEAA